MLILGVDPSTKTGWALYDSSREEIVTYGCIKVPDSKYPNLKNLGDDFRRILRELDCTFVAIEVTEGRMPSHKSQERIIGRLQSICERAGCEVIEVGVGAVKQALTGRGNADKGEMVAAAVQTFGVPKHYEPQYFKEAVADAIGAALAGFEKITEEINREDA